MGDFYQSPIDILDDDVTFTISQLLSTRGKNTSATLTESKTYVPQEKITLQVKAKNRRRYQLVEYHFHHFPNVSGCTGSEHAINGKKQDAEIHFVFAQLGEGQKECSFARHECDVCGGKVPDGVGDLLVIGWLIKFDDSAREKDLSRLQVKLPKRYFEYDGGLTGETSSGELSLLQPVRWLLSKYPLEFKGAQFTPTNTKTTRCLQPLDGRLILAGKEY